MAEIPRVVEEYLVVARKKFPGVKDSDLIKNDYASKVRDDPKVSFGKKRFDVAKINKDMGVTPSSTTEQHREGLDLGEAPRLMTHEQVASAVRAAIADGKDPARLIRAFKKMGVMPDRPQEAPRPQAGFMGLGEQAQVDGMTPADVFGQTRMGRLDRAIGQAKSTVDKSIEKNLTNTPDAAPLAGLRRKLGVESQEIVSMVPGSVAEGIGAEIGAGVLGPVVKGLARGASKKLTSGSLKKLSEWLGALGKSGEISQAQSTKKQLRGFERGLSEAATGERVHSAGASAAKGKLELAPGVQMEDSEVGRSIIQSTSKKMEAERKIVGGAFEDFKSDLEAAPDISSPKKTGEVLSSLFKDREGKIITGAEDTQLGRVLKQLDDATTPPPPKQVRVDTVTGNPILEQTGPTSLRAKQMVDAFRELNELVAKNTDDSGKRNSLGHNLKELAKAVASDIKDGIPETLHAKWESARQGYKEFANTYFNPTVSKVLDKNADASVLPSFLTENVDRVSRMDRALGRSVTGKTMRGPRSREVLFSINEKINSKQDPRVVIDNMVDRYGGNESFERVVGSENAKNLHKLAQNAAKEQSFLAQFAKASEGKDALLKRHPSRRASDPKLRVKDTRTERKFGETLAKVTGATGAEGRRGVMLGGALALSAVVPGINVATLVGVAVTAGVGPTLLAHALYGARAKGVGVALRKAAQAVGTPGFTKALVELSGAVGGRAAAEGLEKKNGNNLRKQP